MTPCPRCNNPLLIDLSLAGQVVACPYCGQQINVNWPVSSAKCVSSLQPTTRQSQAEQCRSGPGRGGAVCRGLDGDLLRWLDHGQSCR